ncbi:MAG: tRNA (adenosine(37)-N6)-dimethylallyltransferase MiaA [Bacteriovoracia bacterium]
MILGLVGPTASGKSDIAIQLARTTGAAILSCDSLLVYKELVVGTAKPTESEMQEVEHFGVNLVSITESFTAADYSRYAKTVIQECTKLKKPLLIVGGTGFYLKNLIFGSWKATGTHPEIRKSLEEKTNDELATILREKDPEYAEKVQTNDRYRLIRGLEIIEVTQKKVSEIKQELSGGLDIRFPIFGIKRSKVELERRIIHRTNQMFSMGLVEETRHLKSLHPEIPKAMHCVGYHEVLKYLNGELSLPECRDRVMISTRQLAKKQMTFFKTFPQEIRWYQLPIEQEQLEHEALKILCNHRS